MEHPVSLELLSPQVVSACGPEVPAQKKAMVAGGLAPLPPADLVTALYVLSYDADESLAGKAGATLSGLPANVLEGALVQVTNEVVLDGLARLLLKQKTATEKILLNGNLANNTALWLTKNIKNEGLLEIIAGNEQRLLACPAIIEALYNNTTVRMSTADRAVELAVRNDIELDGIACFKEVKAAIEGELIPEPTDEPTPDDLMFKQNIVKTEIEGLDEKKIAEALDLLEMEQEEGSEEEDQVESLQQSLANMSISAKIRVATLGSGTQRSILIRDSNKLVCMAVVRSPGIRESEIMQYCRFRSLPEEAVRFMAGNREWTKHYSVKLSLVQNPRCPLEYSLRFLNFLRANDVRALEKDKNVPQAISVAARKLRAKRMS